MENAALLFCCALLLYFLFNGFDRFRRRVDKFDANSHSLEAISDLAASVDKHTCARQPEAQF